MSGAEGEAYGKKMREEEYSIAPPYFSGAQSLLLTHLELIAPDYSSRTRSLKEPSLVGAFLHRFFYASPTFIPFFFRFKPAKPNTNEKKNRNPIFNSFPYQREEKIFNQRLLVSPEASFDFPLSLRNFPFLGLQIMESSFDPTVNDSPTSFLLNRRD
ncbi:hypothetical protein VNO80_19913 [Phaseolus coccineus]|uniref:Uncharacterized protein n=1 Tax=Phaseolus coccineus TaxID=3886 RepID=A0AAN9MH24_PHACN